MNMENRKEERKKLEDIFNTLLDKAFRDEFYGRIKRDSEFDTIFYVRDMEGEEVDDMGDIYDIAILLPYLTKDYDISFFANCDASRGNITDGLQISGYLEITDGGNLKLTDVEAHFFEGLLDEYY